MTDGRRVYDLVLANYMGWIVVLDDDGHSANNYNDVSLRRHGANRLPACRVDISETVRIDLAGPPIKLAFAQPIILGAG